MGTLVVQLCGSLSLPPSKTPSIVLTPRHRHIRSSVEQNGKGQASYKVVRYADNALPSSSWAHPPVWIVYLVFALDAVQTVLAMSDAWEVSIVNWNNPNIFANGFPWQLTTVPLMAGLGELTSP